MRKLIIILTTPLFLLSCDKKADSNDCKNAICTEEYRSVTVNVLDNSGNKVVLQNAYLINLQNADTTIITTAQSFDSTYVVFSDNEVKNMQNKTYNYKFIGTLNGMQVFDEPYTFSADCCHINKVSGKGTITIQ